MSTFCRTALVLSALCALGYHTARMAETGSTFIVSRVPADIDIKGGAPAATLEQAAVFAWQEFIALNWPAAAGRRDVPDAGADLRRANAAPRVWETFRGRAEIYPGAGRPFTDADAAEPYGYERPPRYLYDPARVGGTGAQAGEVSRCPGASSTGPTPWNNLDEWNQQNVHAGLSPAAPWPGQQILVESKANQREYVYVAARGWYGENPIRVPRRRTGEYVRRTLDAPPPPAKIADASDTQHIVLPVGTIEVKAAWRRLGPADDPRQIYVNRVRYYSLDGETPCYIDSEGPGGKSDMWGLVALHVMQKTPSAPYFIWSTFEHMHTLVAGTLDAQGRIVPLEHADGSPTETGAAAQAPFTPDVRVTAATREEDQEIRVDPTLAVKPDLRLYYHQEALEGLPEVKYIALNRRLTPIADEIVQTNRAAQAAIRQAFPDSPLQYYRLVAVQWAPLDKKPSESYTDPYPPGVYYAANLNIEAPPVNQRFSGQFVNGFVKTSDYLNEALPFLNPAPNPRDPVFANVYYGGKAYLSGGCMGCHGSRQAYGTDWSFLLDRQRVGVPNIKLGDRKIE